MSNSPYISLNEAAALTGRAKSTISKALKNGKMSYISKDPKTGAYEIDPAEALRTFPTKQETSKDYQKETPRNPTENSILEVKLQVANQRYEEAQKIIDDLRDDRDAWKHQATALIDDRSEKRQPSTSPSKGRIARAWEALTR